MRLRAVWFLALAPCSCAAGMLDWKDAPLQAYKAEHFAAMGERIVAVVDREELARRVRDAQVLYLGDHHRDRALHDRLLGILEDLDRRGVRFALALEAIGTQDEPAVADYLAGRIDLAALRRRVRARWPGSWLDRAADVDSEFYREMLRRARRRGWPVHALEPTPRLSLESRDAVIAGRLRSLAERGSRPIVAVLGHAHLLGPGHVVERAGLGGPVVAARASPRLAREAESLVTPSRSSLWLTDAGVLLVPPSHARRRTRPSRRPHAW